MRENYERHLRALVSGAEISTRVSLNALARILDDGRFKTSHEPGCLQSKNPPRSPAEEAQVWNVQASSLSELPIFGYAATIADVSVPQTRATLHMAYGSARVVLQAQVRSRCTVFFGDSLWAVRHDEGAPAPLERPDELCWLPERGLPSERLELDEGGPDEVVEVQIIKRAAHERDRVGDLRLRPAAVDSRRTREARDPLLRQSDADTAAVLAGELRS
jgi:hypothetical protein